MAKTLEIAEDIEQRCIVVSRLLKAPRELVFEVFTDVRHAAQWWGPEGFSTSTHEADVRPGGRWRFIMHGPDGTDYPNLIVFDEIEHPERISYRQCGEEEYADIQFRTVITFEAQGNATLVTLRSEFQSAELRDATERNHHATEGGRQHLGRLDAYLNEAMLAKGGGMTLTLPSEREIRLTRVFQASPRQVFEAFTAPQHISQWWGSASFEMTVCEMDFRVGGAWRFVQRDGDGNEHPFRGVYLEIEPPHRLSYTFVYDVEGLRDFEAVETVQLESFQDKTLLINTIRHTSQEARDGQLGAGMEGGARESFERLAALVEPQVPGT